MSPHEEVLRQGPVTRRGHARTPGTTDQRLLDSRPGGTWVHEDPWRVLRIQSEFVNGFGDHAADCGDAIIQIVFNGIEIAVIRVGNFGRNRAF